ncbi:MAG: S26 family signal peptidase [Natronomonas sp.]
MKYRDLFQYVAVIAFVMVILLLLFTQLLGQPVVVFVETGSMAPTLDPNDGYFAIPAFFANEIDEGDVILFQAQELGGGELTTHRVEAETDEGYITKGDANPFTDQEGDEPPVSEGQIKSVGLQMNGNLVVIPGLGATVGSLTGTITDVLERIFEPFGIEPPSITTFSTGVLVVGLILLVFSVLTGSVDKRERSRSHGGLLQNAIVIIAILTLVVIIPVNFSMLLPSGTYQYEIISSNSPTDQEQVIQAGGSSEVTYFMRNSGHLPVVVFLEPASPGVELTDESAYVPRRTTVNTNVVMHAPEETGAYYRFVRESRYLVVLPPSMIAALHGIHPILAIAAINLVVASVVIAVGITSIGTDRVRLRSKSRDITLLEHLHRNLPPILITRRSPGFPNGDTRDTIYNWLRGREPRSGQFHDPVGSERSVDLDRSFGHRSALTDGFEELTDRQRLELVRDLNDPPHDVGIDASGWTPIILQRYLRERYDVRLSSDRCRLLLVRADHDPEWGISDTDRP